MTWLDEIREREQAATKGPWHYFYEGSGSHSVFQTGGDREIVSCETGWGLTDKSNIIWEQAASDCRFVAESREDIPNLLTYVDVLEKALNKNTKLIDELRSYKWPIEDDDLKSMDEIQLDIEVLIEKALSWRPE